jgi:hypothetical protein
LALSDQHDVDQISVSRAGSVAGERARHGDESARGSLLS